MKMATLWKERKETTTQDRRAEHKPPQGRADGDERGAPEHEGLLPAGVPLRAAVRVVPAGLLRAEPG
eukprot:CAMPEP_0175308616 /NCGR_PEP_ID=MMETSP0093-20121207/65382_1 /TAXON_ID=311494 /ORGANISM="Alexandrium monilatum, Strain CCMP3105" /LENGTH=66 /DNA_ID=CAMNT_0016605141 /DNA_START=20 /DNA_END=217 /DNA_ORIENTATION=+